MTDQPAKVLKQQVDKIRARCDFMEAQIERDESLISDMIDYLSEGKDVDVENLDFSTDFKPALMVELPILTLPEDVNCTPCPFQLKSKTLFLINQEIVLCLKLANSSSNKLFDISGSILVEDEHQKNLTVLESRSITLTFINKSDKCISNQNGNWHKFCPIQTDSVGSGQTFYFVMAFPPADKAVTCTIVVYCASAKCDETFSLISCIEQHKWNRWQGVMSRFICDPWELRAPSCLTDDNITSPDNFLMNICSLSAFLMKRKFKLHNSAELKKVFAFPGFQMDIISGQTSILYSKLSCLSNLIVFIQNQDADPGSFILCSKENVMNIFLNKLNSLNIGFEQHNDSNVDEFDNTVEVLFNEKIKIMKQLERFGKDQSGDKIVTIDGVILRNMTTNLASLELKRLCLSDQLET